MKTAVEWYCNEMESLRVNAEINSMDAYKFIIRRAEIFEQAKAMEKEQIMKAFYKGRQEEQYKNLFNNHVRKSEEQYYNETYESKTNI